MIICFTIAVITQIVAISLVYVYHKRSTLNDNHYNYLVTNVNGTQITVMHEFESMKVLHEFESSTSCTINCEADNLRCNWLKINDVVRIYSTGEKCSNLMWKLPLDSSLTNLWFKIEIVSIVFFVIVFIMLIGYDIIGYRTRITERQSLLPQTTNNQI